METSCECCRDCVPLVARSRPTMSWHSSGSLGRNESARVATRHELIGVGGPASMQAPGRRSCRPGSTRMPQPSPDGVGSHRVHSDITVMHRMSGERVLCCSQGIARAPAATAAKAVGHNGETHRCLQGRIGAITREVPRESAYRRCSFATQYQFLHCELPMSLRAAAVPCATPASSARTSLQQTSHCFPSSPRRRLRGMRASSCALLSAAHPSVSS